MPRILPRPFDDLVDLRTDDQRQADALRTGEQREQLLSLQNDDNQAELVRILQERRAANTDAVVRFEMAERPLPPALVVPREILLRSDPNQDFAAADEILRAAGFEPRDLVDHPIECGELAEEFVAHHHTQHGIAKEFQLLVIADYGDTAGARLAG